MLDKQASDGRSPDLQEAGSVKQHTEALMGMLSIRASSLGAPDGHSDRVAEYATAIGRRLDLPKDTLSTIGSAAILHDIGKVGISRQIVDKLGRLTAREFEIMRLHSTIAVKMLEKVDALKDALPMIKHHHERFDGKGYPDGLAGHDIPLGARIIAVAETFDMLISEVPWRDALVLETALEELKGCAGTQFDPMVVDVFVAAIKANQVNLPEGLDRDDSQPPFIPKFQ